MPEIANSDRGFHGFKSYADAKAAAARMTEKENRPWTVINLGFFSGLSILRQAALDVVSKKSA